MRNDKRGRDLIMAISRRINCSPHHITIQTDFGIMRMFSNDNVILKDLFDVPVAQYWVGAFEAGRSLIRRPTESNE